MSKIKTSFHHFTKRITAGVKAVAVSTPLAIITAAIILGASHVAYAYVTKDGTSTPSAPTTLFTGKPIDDKDHIEGNAKSDVIVVEYSDPECPYCISLHPAMKQLRNEYEDRIAFVYRYFPLTQIHPHSFEESKAIACAATLGGTKAFYEYIDNIYGYKVANKTNELPATGKEDIATNIGLKKEAFNACMKNSDTDLTINASINDGVQAGVQGTPSTFILKKTKQGYEVTTMVDGARPYEFIKAAIDQALAK